MDVDEVIRKRRSIKSYSSREISKVKLLDLVDTARHSPSGNNTNPWRFVVVTERKSLVLLSKTHPYGDWLASAQAGIAILADSNQTRYWLEDCIIAAYSIWLSATGHGIGVAWAAIYQSDNLNETERRQKFVRKVLSIPDKFSIPVILGIGYPDALPSKKESPPLRDLVFWERYDAEAQQ